MVARYNLFYIIGACFNFGSCMFSNLLAIASGSYEKACVLFNVAALQTIIADQQKLILDDGLKTAAKLFQVFERIYKKMKQLILINTTWFSQFNKYNIHLTLVLYKSSS